MEFFNFIYERVPYKIVRIMVQYVKIPNKSFRWKIILINKKAVISKIYKDNPKTWQIPLSYKWHDLGLNYLEFAVTNYLKEKHNACWIDCGANLGLRSLTALSVTLKTVMIEPNKELNSLNRERCEQNNFTNFNVLQFGVSNSNIERKLYIDKSSYLSSLSEELIDKSNVDRIEIISLRKLDTLFAKELEVEEFNAFIKIDVEGHEKEVLEGAQNLIDKHSPTFVIEINEKGEHIKGLVNSMRKNNYKVYETLHDNINPNCFLKMLPEELTNHSYNSNDFLFVKKDDLNNILSKFSFN